MSQQLKWYFDHGILAIATSDVNNIDDAQTCGKGLLIFAEKRILGNYACCMESVDLIRSAFAGTFEEGRLLRKKYEIAEKHILVPCNSALTRREDLERLVPIRQPAFAEMFPGEWTTLIGTMS